ncbi:MAG: ABC transporter permease [Candidatus Omnitrophota bacterium]
MVRYIAKRFLVFLFLFLSASTVVFFLIRLLPGDPALGVLGDKVQSEDLERIRGELNGHQPIGYQYLVFLKHTVGFHLGHSLVDGQPVSRLIFVYFPNTLYLAFLSMALALLLSLPIGVWVAFKGQRKPLVNAAVTLVGSIGLIPSFVLGPLLVFFFSIRLGWLPVSGSGDFPHILLPALTLGISMGAFLMPLIRGAVEIELEKPYILLARAKGLSDFRIFKNHVLKNAMIPVLTMMGLQFGSLLAGTVITEMIFSWQGIGSLLIGSIHRRDEALIQGIVLFIIFVYMFIHFLIDLSYLFIDPRIRAGYSDEHHH